MGGAEIILMKIESYMIFQDGTGITIYGEYVPGADPEIRFSAAEDQDGDSVKLSNRLVAQAEEILREEVNKEKA